MQSYFQTLCPDNYQFIEWFIFIIGVMLMVAGLYFPVYCNGRGIFSRAFFVGLTVAIVGWVVAGTVFLFFCFQ